MDLFSGKKVGVSQEERRLPYFKYYEQDMASISDEKIRLMAAPQLSPCVPFEERDLFLQGKDTEYCQIGYGTAPNGTGFVCNERHICPASAGKCLTGGFRGTV